MFDDKALQKLVDPDNFKYPDDATEETKQRIDAKYEMYLRQVRSGLRNRDGSINVGIPDTEEPLTISSDKNIAVQGGRRRRARKSRKSKKNKRRKTKRKY